MKVIYNPGRRKYRFKNPVLAIGVFDGLHLGHQSLIKKVVARARFLKGTAVVMTFNPHPLHVLRPQVALPLLCPLEYRLALIKSLGVRVCIVINFTPGFSRLSAEKFMEKFLTGTIAPCEIFVGQNFRFGKDRSGDVDALAQWGRGGGIRVQGVATLKKDGHVVSSSYIRQLIHRGQIVLAGRLLGRPVSCIARVIKGDGRGRKLGFSTANISFGEQIVVPNGVYQTRVIVDGKLYRGMTNVGCRPSFYKKNSFVNVETHIFDFHENLYDRQIEIQFLKKIRDERRFSNSLSLSRQLHRDQVKIRALFRRSSG